MAKYRLIPNIVEANMIDEYNVMDIAVWINNRIDISKLKIFAMPRNDGLMVPTANGHVLALFGDWAIYDSGQFTVSKPVVFAKNHQLLGPTSDGN
jgi:hypothetical protein